MDIWIENFLKWIIIIICTYGKYHHRHRWDTPDFIVIYPLLWCKTILIDSDWYILLLKVISIRVPGYMPTCDFDLFVGKYLFLIWCSKWEVRDIVETVTNGGGLSLFTIFRALSDSITKYLHQIIKSIWKCILKPNIVQNTSGLIWNQTPHNMTFFTFQ